MESLQALEISILVFLQSLGSWLAAPLQAASLLGNEEFYMLAMPALYWSVNTALGLRMAMMLILSNGFNTIFKCAFHLPRPYWVDTQVVPLSSETSFGIPSGHAMNAASMWGLMVSWSRNAWVRAGGVVLIFLIGFSRLYLGMHYLSDVLAGWLLGGLLLLAFLRLEAPVAARLRAMSFRQQAWLALASALVIMAAILLARAAVGAWQLPEIWVQNASRQPGGEPIDPFNIEGAFTLSGIWFGALFGAAWFQHRFAGYSAAGSPAQRLLRYFIGVIGIFVFWFALGQVLPRDPDVISYALRFARYTLVGLWVTAGAPWIFLRAGLMPKAAGRQPSFS